MNTIEQKMLELIKDLRDNYGAIAIKAEFEAEGSRMEELIRLNELVCRADMELFVKIGGCEAMRDLYDAEILGATGIMAPMIETPFAMRKFLVAIHNAYSPEIIKNKKFIVNTETITCFENIEGILTVPGIEILESIVVGRVDLAGSLGLGRREINENQIFELTEGFAKAARLRGIKIGVGGGVSMDSIPFFERLRGVVDKCETRKVVFKIDVLDDMKAALLKAMEFENLYLKNKQNIYQKIAEEDVSRIEMMEHRILIVKEELNCE